MVFHRNAYRGPSREDALYGGSYRAHGRYPTPPDTIRSDSSPLLPYYDYSSVTSQNHHMAKRAAQACKDKRLRSSKITYDPDLRKDPSKGSKPIYIFTDRDRGLCEDPRPKALQKIPKLLRRPHSSVLIPKYKYDKYSVGPEPSSQLVIWNFPTTTPLVIIKNNFAQFGKILELKGIDDPLTAVPLGICVLKYDGDPDSAHQAATRAVAAVHKKLQIGGQYLRCGLNNNDQLFNIIYNRILDAKQQQLIKEKEERRRQQELQMMQKRDEQKREREEQRREREERKKLNRSSRDQLPVKLSAHDRHVRTLSSVTLPFNFDKHIANRPFLLIPDKFVNTRNVNSSDIRKLLSGHEFDRILTHKSGFYVVFNNIADAEKCFDEEDGRHFSKYKLYMDFVVPDELMSQTKIGERIGETGQAKAVLIREFHDYLLKDLREKVIGPKLLSFLDSDKYKSVLEKHLKEKEDSKETKPDASKGPAGVSSFTVQHQSIPISTLSTFRRKPVEKKYKRKINAVPMAHALNYSDNESEDEDQNKSSKKQKLLAIESTSSSDEEDMQELPESKATSQPTSPESLDRQIDESEPDQKKDLLVSELYKPSHDVGTTVYDDDYSNMDFDLNSLQAVIHDEEDFVFAKKAFEDLPKSEEIKNVKLWAWKHKEYAKKIKHLSSMAETSAEDAEAIEFSQAILKNDKLQNSTGSFRTQGYYKIPDKMKSEYLLHRRKAHRPLNTVQNEDESETQAVQSSRVNRANNRRFAADISAQKQMLGSETDILDLNQLTKRKKPVQFARSAIHNWGLYALEPIAAKEMIIEYVGERIRQQVAEVREKKYLRSGIGSSYLFRIDENTVIDASKKGGIARFINHCCVPSCTAKIIKVEGKKRIVIYALRDIAANEELTYDYKFERETNDEERIPCLCGAPGCKGYLN
ncbi:hypothetical protein KL933_003481 [Ogataea haglerorum]|uniref:Histone-lysine N-methyltransferase, H3 lysine-4 specific n=1 Tax=Ogataea haglerorum TaxID=1937702 RepID=A0AAN6D5F7_9ASCO|nr:hypothetical protein KL933_003481 [Ogataea haglerorum]